MKNGKRFKILWIVLTVFWSLLLVLRIIVDWDVIWTGELEAPLEWLVNVLMLFASAMQWRFWRSREQNQNQKPDGTL